MSVVSGVLNFFDVFDVLMFRGVGGECWRVLLLVCGGTWRGGFVKPTRHNMVISVG